MLNSIDWRDANQSALIRQHLAPDARDASVVQVTRDVAGLHATSAATPYLSLFNRVSGFEQGDLEQALYKDRSLARVRCVRRTIYIHSTDLLPIVMATTAPMVVKASRRYMVVRGVSLDEYGMLAEEIRQLLVGTEMTAPAIRAALGTAADVSAVLNLMCDDGILVRGRPERGWKDQRHRYALFCEWFPNVDLGRMSAEEATIEIVRRYMAAFGPVTEEDVAWWTGLGRRRYGRLLRSLEASLPNCACRASRPGCTHSDTTRCRFAQRDALVRRSSTSCRHSIRT